MTDLLLKSIYFDIDEKQWPILYRDEYNVRFWKLEKLHPFDAQKWHRVINFLLDDGILKQEMLVAPIEVQKEHLLLVHTQRYLRSLKWSFNVSLISEIPPLLLVPNPLVQKCYLKPMRYQVGGTIQAGKLALERGYAINVGGGFHHCSGQKGGGFCPYADITLLVKYLVKFYSDRVSRVMIVDLDAHQGNGYARDLMDDAGIFIMDMYNPSIYPHDEWAKKAISCKVELRSRTRDHEYLRSLRGYLNESLEEFKPNFVVYNAGTDVLDGDPLGFLSISPDGVLRRDEIVFRACTGAKIPIAMLLSGGYQKKSARVIADSIANLAKIGLIGAKAEPLS